jgi:hypothetical protein
MTPEEAKKRREALRRLELKAREMGLDISEPTRNLLFGNELQHELRCCYPHKGLGVIYGAPGSYKSTLARELAWCDLNGLPFLGHETKNFAARVLYIAGEDAGHTHEHFSECVDRAKAKSSPWEAPLIVRGGGLNLRDPKSVDQLVKLLTERHDLVVPNEEGAAPFEVVFIDTVQSVAGAGFDVMRPDHVSDAVRGMKALRDGLEAVWVWALTHAGKDASAGIKGSSTWSEDPDLILRIERPERASGGRRGRLVIEKDRQLGREGQHWPFRIDSIESLYASAGDESSFRVVCAGDAPVTGRALMAEDKLPDSERRALDVLRRLAADGVAPDAAQVEAMKAAGCDAQTLVPSTTWQSAFVESGDGSPESEKRAFRRAVDGLAKKRAVLRIGEFACPTP